jgi:hypothetical protein
MGDDWMPVEGKRNYWNPVKEGDEIIGKLAGIEDGSYGKKYTLEVIKDGKSEMIPMPSHKLLQGRLSECSLGDMIKVVFKGTQPPKVRGENPLMLYDVFRKPVEEKVQ